MKITLRDNNILNLTQIFKNPNIEQVNIQFHRNGEINCDLLDFYKRVVISSNGQTVPKTALLKNVVNYCISSHFRVYILLVLGSITNIEPILIKGRKLFNRCKFKYKFTKSRYDIFVAILKEHDRIQSVENTDYFIILPKKDE